MPRKTQEVPFETDGNVETLPAVEYSYDVFFSGPEGFGEHIQIKSEDVSAFLKGRGGLLDALKTLGATPRWQDEKRPVRNGDMEKAAKEVFGDGVTQDLGTKNCPVDGTVMTSYPAGFSRTKTDKNGKPKRFGPRFVCPKCQNTIWADEK